MNKFIIATILLLILNSLTYANSIKVAVSANMSYAIPKIVKKFNNNYPNIKVDIILGSSGKLTSQILFNAPFDIFLSANMLYPQKLYNKQFAITKPYIYAYGSIVIISKKQFNLKNWKQLLLNKKVQKIAIANPKTAPYGIATAEALRTLKLYDRLKSKFIYGESISQTVTYASKVTDIGFVAYSSLFSPYMKQFRKKDRYKLLNKKLYTPIAQGVVLLKHSLENKDSKLFYDFLKTNDAKNIFEDYGYQI